MLSIDALTVAYGGLAALSQVTLSVREGQFVSIVGPNGAGKTTLFKAISGTVRRLDERTVGVLHREDVHSELLVLQQVLDRLDRLRVAANRGQRGVRREEHVRPDLAALGRHVAERRGQAGGTLSGGEQQMLAIGRGIASSPRLLMLDEPSMGLAPRIADLIFERIGELHRDGLTILLVEQRVAEAVQSCDFGYVLETGRVVLEGSHETLLADDRIRRVYLGM